MRLLIALFLIVLSEARRKHRVHLPTASEDESLPKHLVNVVVYSVQVNSHVSFEPVQEAFKDANIKLILRIFNDPNQKELTKSIYYQRLRVPCCGRAMLQPISGASGKLTRPEKYQSFIQEDNGNNTAARNGLGRMWFDMSSTQLRNIARPPDPRMMGFKNQPQPEPERPKYHTPNIREPDKERLFGLSSFDLASNIRGGRDNWTTCNDLGRMNDFHPKDIVNVDWIPFYVWSPRSYFIAVVHRFSYPTKKLVKKYKDEFGQFLNKSIDWEQPKLVLRGMTEMLLVAADRTGLFHAIIYHEIPENLKTKSITLPKLTIKFKTEDPYLAMVYCEDQFATVMAVAGTEPGTNREKIAEAKTLKFKGQGFPVQRDLEMEKIRTQAENDWKRESEANKFLNIDMPIIRDHYFGRDGM